VFRFQDFLSAVEARKPAQVKAAWETMTSVPSRSSGRGQGEAKLRTEGFERLVWRAKLISVGKMWHQQFLPVGHFPQQGDSEMKKRRGRDAHRTHPPTSSPTSPDARKAGWCLVISCRIASGQCAGARSTPTKPRGEIVCVRIHHLGSSEREFAHRSPLRLATTKRF